MGVLQQAITAACYSRECAPPPVGSGGSSPKPGSPRHTARSIVRRALQVGPQIRRDMLAAARAHEASLGGLKFMYKSESSLLRKIVAKTPRGAQFDPEKAKEGVADAVRFTFLIDTPRYTPSTKAILGDLQKAGYEVVRPKNFWRRGDDYQGLNVQLVHMESGHRVEVQFHTPESHDVKETKLHPLYEKWRTMRSGSERTSIYRQMVKIADSIPRPPNVHTIPRYI